MTFKKPLRVACMLAAIFQLLVSFHAMGQTRFSEILALKAEPPTKQVKYAAGPLQFAEYWQATEATAPLVVLLHGGCWLNEYGVDHVRPLAAALAENGYAVWSVEYRRVGDPGGGWPGTATDILAALNAVATLEEIDQRRVFLVGHSAGGHLALWAGAAADFDRGTAFSGELKIEIKGVVGLAAISDLVAYAAGDNSCQQATPQFMGGMPDAQPERYQQASPRGLSLKVPTVLIHGLEDVIVDPAQSLELSRSSENINLVSLESLGHFDLINPRTAAFQQILVALKKLDQ